MFLLSDNIWTCFSYFQLPFILTVCFSVIFPGVILLFQFTGSFYSLKMFSFSVHLN